MLSHLSIQEIHENLNLRETHAKPINLVERVGWIEIGRMITP